MKETVNRNAYLTSSLVIKALSNISKTKMNIYGKENIPKGSIIFVINHFTRVETIFIPYHIFRITNNPVWSLADAGLFKGAFGNFLNSVGAVSTRSPDRDLLIVNSLLTGQANWIIFPEGRMVKNKKIFQKGQFLISYAGRKYPPHTGAAILALRTEFYRQRLIKFKHNLPNYNRQIMKRFNIDSIVSLIRSARL